MVDKSVDGRLYDSVLYSKAHTGRWAGTGLQPHNLPRGVTPKDFEWTTEHTDKRLADVITDYAAKWEKKPEAILGSMLRGLIIGDPLAIADWSQIEARIVQWISGGDLTPFVEGRPYESFAAKLFGVGIDDVTKVQRAVGKMGVLSCAYGVGGRRLTEQATGMGVDFAAVGLTGQKVVNAWRDANPWIAGSRTGEQFESSDGVVHELRTKDGLWKTIERAMWDATRGVETSVGRCVIHKDGRDVLITLPSRRSLRYRDAKIERVKKWGSMRNEFRFAHPKGYREGTYGGKIVENCLASDTRVVCPRGIIPLKDVKITDPVWDGRRWVQHNGLVNRGMKEVGEWLGVRLTCDHRIFDGKRWISAINAGVGASLDALRWALDSVRGMWFLGGSETEVSPSVYATVALRRASEPDNCGEELKVSVSTAHSGHEAASCITSTEDVPESGLWRDTGGREEVFDLLDCGPNNRFTIVTDYGPVVVHNCCQAIGRDILGHTLVECEKAGIPVVMHVHDEVIAETDRLADLIEIMTTPPAWAKGLPLAAEGKLAERYSK